MYIDMALFCTYMSCFCVSRDNPRLVLYSSIYVYVIILF